MKRNLKCIITREQGSFLLLMNFGRVKLQSDLRFGVHSMPRSQSLENGSTFRFEMLILILTKCNKFLINMELNILQNLTTIKTILILWYEEQIMYLFLNGTGLTSSQTKRKRNWKHQYIHHLRHQRYLILLKGRSYHTLLMKLEKSERRQQLLQIVKFIMRS